MTISEADSFRRFSCGERISVRQKTDVRSTLHRARIFYHADPSIGGASPVVTLDFVETSIVFLSLSLCSPPLLHTLSRILHFFFSFFSLVLFLPTRSVSSFKAGIPCTAPITCRGINWFEKTEPACERASFSRGLVTVIVANPSLGEFLSGLYEFVQGEFDAWNDRSKSLERKLINYNCETEK